ncbi:head GIN domain-containing protein [Chryseobacterium sp. Chry.R1]|uniref:head GIN domain-containing protein n=1 Tax=Chryseobacterium sp. Chry.R1 TaxID=3139392 RepID=UPI0031F8B420
MKTTTLFIFSTLIAVSACNEKYDRKNKEKSDWVSKVVDKGSGPIREKEFKGEFDEIEVSQAIDAEIIKSETERVVISAPENLIDEILVDNTGGKLHIHYKPGIRVMNQNNVTAKIYAKDFTKLDANSAGKITVKDKFTQEKTDIEISSAGSVTGDLEANNFEISAGSSSSFEGKIWAIDLEIDASSAASISLTGKSKNANITSSSGSSVSAEQVLAENVKAEASSGASVEISATSKIDANASSGGSIDVHKKGNVTSVNKEESSGGSVNIH